MPYYTTSPRKDEPIVERLAKELTKPPLHLIVPGRLPKETHGKKRGRVPVVIEEEQPVGHRFRVTVIWDAWATVPEEDRGAMILDAYERSLGAEKTARITRAMGVTTEEARALGII